MSDEAFSADWLTLREPVDHRSRSRELVSTLRTAWAANGWLRVLDLGSGTGSNVRYLAPRLTGPQQWTLIDHDEGLLARATWPSAVEGAETVVGDLAKEGIDSIAMADLVTGSALLDLVTDAWLDRLVMTCRDASVGAYFALTFDGAIRWSNSDGEPDDDPDDAMIRKSITEHQRRDRGEATALGPTGGAVADRRFAAAGFRTWRRASPWRLGPAEAPLAVALIDGWEHASLDLDPSREQAERIRRWAERRRAATNGDFHLTVGHDDVLALPPSR